MNMTLNKEAIEQDTIKSFRIIFQAIQRHSFDVEKTCGVSATQLWAMTELNNEPGLRVSDIANRLCIKISTASNMLDKIEQKKLLLRERGKEDQRVVKLFLTPAGKKLLRQAPNSPQGPVLAAISTMTPKQARQLYESLQILVTKIHSSKIMPSTEPLDSIST